MSEDWLSVLKRELDETTRDDITAYMSEKWSQPPKRVPNIRELVEEYRRLERHFPRQTDDSDFFLIPADEKADTLAAIVAGAVEGLEAVKVFRAEVLGDKLLPPDEVPGWIIDQATLPAREIADSKKSPAKRSGESGSAEMLPYEQLHAFRRVNTVPHRLYYWEKDGTAKSAPLRPGSVLTQLKALISEILPLCPVWEEPDMVGLILTGAVPPIPLAIMTIDAAGMYRSQSRILISADPRLTPARLASEFSKIRSSALPGESVRDKMLSKKHLALAILASRKKGERGRSWSDMLHEWNDEHPDWSYEGRNAVVLFSRDARNAWGRLTGEAWR